MNKPLLSWPYVALVSLLLFGATASAQQKLNLAQQDMQPTTAVRAQTAPLSTATVLSPIQQAENGDTTPSDDHNPNASPFDAVQGKKEAVEKRDAFSKHYVNEDGSYTALIGAGPIHYEKNGAFLDIDHNITRSNDANFPYANTANLFESYFGVNTHTGVKSKTAEGEVTEFVNTHMYWEVNGTAVNTTVSANAALTIDGNKATFNNMYGNIAAEFDVLTGKRELNYVIPTQADLGNVPANADYLVFVEDVILPQGWRATESDNGILITDTRGTDVYLYENPRSTDAAEMLAARETNTVFEMTQNENVVTIATKVKTDWLLSNDRQYPVKVDPTVNVYPNNEYNWTGEAWEDGDQFEDELFVGRYNFWNPTLWVAGYSRFDLSSIPDNSTVNSAIGYININYGTGIDITTRTWAFVNSADPLTYTGNNLFNTMTTAYSQSVQVVSLGWKNSTFSLTGRNAIEAAINNDFISLGIYAMGTWQVYGNQQNGTYFIADGYSSSNRPYLAIDYTIASTPPTDVVFYNVDGDDDEVQLAFNNSRSDNSQPIFRLSHQTETADTYEIQVSSNPTFSGATTQQFNGTYATNTETNFEFTENFSPADNTTYYVRARAAKDSDWSDWSSQIHTFTYKDDQETSDWYQTTKVQFETGTLDGVEVPTGTHYVTPQTGGSGDNPFVNPSFENGMTGWSITRTGTWYTVASETYGNSDGQYSLNIYNNAPNEYGYFSGDAAGAYQNIDLTNIDNISFDAGYEGQGSIIVQCRVYISEPTQTNTTAGTLVHTWTPPSNLSMGNEMNIDISSYNFTGNKLVKFIFYVTGQETTYNQRYLYIDNINASGSSSTEGTITSTPIHLASVAGADGYAGVTWEQELNGGELNLKVQGSANGTTFTDISGYTAISENTDGVHSFDLSGIDASTYPHIRLVGELDGEDVKMYNWSVSFDVIPDNYFVYLNDIDEWDPYYPGDLGPNNEPKSDDESTILVKEGTAVFYNPVESKDLTINSGATLEIESVLDVHGDLTINGDLIFKSTATYDGELGVMAGTVTGKATVHRYMKDKRSYRMVSPAVTTAPATIRDNWQEGVNNTQRGYENNINPNPGFGTHITGSTTGANGFDATGTGNPSMFTVNVASQVFQAIDNTATNTLIAGSPYLMMVRGSRAIDLTDNDAHGETILRATGELVTTSDTQQFGNLFEGDFIMFGNPYQSAVDINSVFGNSSSLNTNHYYIYDPTLGDYGAYVTINLPDGTNESNSAGNEYLQPGQAAQVAVLGGSTSVVFNPSDKTPGQHTSTQRGPTRLRGDNKLAVQLYTTENYNQGGPVHDSFAMLFDDSFDNAITPVDAIMPFNFYENMGIDNDGVYLSIEYRQMPEEGEVYPLFTDGYTHTEYTLKLMVDGLENTVLYLQDHYTGESTLLETGAIAYNFIADQNDPSSLATDRFAILTESVLGVSDHDLFANISLYPNPMNGDMFYINAPQLNGKQVAISISDLRGRLIYAESLNFHDNKISVSTATNLASGVYMVTLNHEGAKHTFKLIKE